MKKMSTMKEFSINEKSIIPSLPPNFHKSLFFTEIQYQTKPSKNIKKYLINLYIQGIDYYSSTKQQDLSLYFQTKLLNLMKEVDYFEKTLSKKETEININIDSEKKNILSKAENIENNIYQIIDKEMQEQKNKFLNNLSIKKKYFRFKRINSIKFRRKSSAFNADLRSKKPGSIRISKRVSIDLTNTLYQKVGDKNNIIFNKIENGLNGLDRINTLLFIGYTKKLKKYTKEEINIMNERIKKYYEYIRSKNELILLYDDFEDKNADDAKAIKEQIKIIEKEWEDYENNIKKNKDENKNYGLVNIERDNLDKIMENISKKIKEYNIVD